MQAKPPLRFIRRKLLSARGGFSLVEICLALGIVAFALVPLVGLLAVGLDSYRNASLRVRAAQVVGKISSAIRAANNTGSNVYNAAAPFDPSSKVPISWTLTNIPTTTPGQFTIYFDENGELTTLTTSGAGWNPPQMVAMVLLIPPTTQFDAGEAQIAVAWPALRAPTYTASTGVTFANPQGHNETTISFAANSP